MSVPHDDKVNDDAIAAFLSDHAAWRRSADGRALERDWRFSDFNAAWGFMTRIALLAERRDHHPDWRNVYNRVEMRLNSHDVDGVSARDLAFAAMIDAMGD